VDLAAAVVVPVTVVPVVAAADIMVAVAEILGLVLHGVLEEEEDPIMEVLIKLILVALTLEMDR
jgi:hypothetical protein